MNPPIASRVAKLFRSGNGGIALWVALSLLSGGLANASDLPPVFKFDVPVAPNLATPYWLGHPESTPANFAVLNLPILTPDPGAALLVTVYFEEKEGGFMRIAWRGTQGAQLLSDNFYEGIAMRNQRSLLIAPETLVGDGTLTFQCGDSQLGIRRIKLEWLESRASLASPELRDFVVAPAVGPTLLGETLGGSPQQAEAGAWQGQIVTVPLADVPQRVEEGVDFSVDLDKVPAAARLSLKESGLALGSHLVVWVNEHRAGTITPAVPDLQDDGFVAEGAATHYTGWRDGSFFVPVGLLKPGANLVQFSDEADASPDGASAPSSSAQGASPLALKQIVLQLNYPAESVSATGTVAVSSTTPSPTSSSTSSP